MLNSVFSSQRLVLCGLIFGVVFNLNYCATFLCANYTEPDFQKKAVYKCFKPIHIMSQRAISGNNQPEVWGEISLHLLSTLASVVMPTNVWPWGGIILNTIGSVELLD